MGGPLRYLRNDLGDPARQLRRTGNGCNSAIMLPGKPVRPRHITTGNSGTDHKQKILPENSLVDAEGFDQGFENRLGLADDHQVSKCGQRLGVHKDTHSAQNHQRIAGLHCGPALRRKGLQASGRQQGDQPGIVVLEADGAKHQGKVTQGP